MLGPVSGTGRAMMASLQQAMSNGMPPDQAVQYVKSMATQGVAPLTDLYAMMNQFQRLKQQPVQAPQTPPTIRDQLNMAEQQQMAMQQGLGGLPAPSMEQAQFAGGGIVAFDEGGSVESYYQNLDPLRASSEDREVLRILKKGPAARTSQDNAILREVGFKLSQEEPASEDGIIGRANRALGILREPFIRGEMATLSDEELAKAGGTGAINERIYRGLGGSRYVAPTAAQTAVPAPAASVAAQTSPFSTLPTDINPFSQAGRAERQALNFMEGARSRPEVADVRKNLSSTAVSTAPRVTAVAPAAAAPAQLTREDMESREYDRRRAFREREGLGAAREEMRSFLTDEGNKLAEQFGKDRMLAFAEAGFKMAAAASRPGATFLGAMSEGAISGTQALRGLQKEMNANRRGLRESMLKLREAEELEKMGDFDKAAQVAQQARTEMFQRQQHDDKIRVDLATIAASVENSRRSSGATVRAAEIAAGARGQAGAISPEDMMRSKLSVLNDRAGSLNKYINDFRTTVYDPTGEQITEYEGALRELANVEAQRNQLTGLSGATSLSGGQNFSGFTARLKE
jgi:hypothetical protein